MMLILLVASINIASAIVMLVMERKKEIAILKSLGEKPSNITLSFVISGLACGLGGLIIGIPCGIIISLFSNQCVAFIEKVVNFFVRLYYHFKGSSMQGLVKLMDPAYHLQKIPVIIPADKILLICLFTLILSLLVSLIPSVKAGKEKPLDILRKN